MKTDGSHVKLYSSISYQRQLIAYKHFTVLAFGLDMFSSRRSIIIVLAMAFSCLLYMMRPIRGQMHNYPRLCDSLSKKAPRQHLKICQNVEEDIADVRVKRDVNTTQQMFPSTTQKQPVTRNLPWHLKYECDKKRPSRNPKGFPSSGYGLNLTVKFVKHEDWWTAVVNWNKPKPEPGRDRCTGYEIQWVNKYKTCCDYINSENQTSYIIDSSKGWNKELSYEEDDRLFVAVFPLPSTGQDGTITLRVFQPPACSDPTRAAISPSRTTQIMEKTFVKNTVTQSLTQPSTQPGKQNRASTGPVVNKLVFSIVISSIAVGILIIVLLIYKKRRSRLFIFERKNKTLNGASHYISYDANNKKEATDIALWLQDNNVNVIIDRFSLIISNKRAWSEQQLLQSEKIIMIITKKYLDICTQSKSKLYKQKGMSYNDELLCNEISLIRNKLIDMETNKFIGILIDTKMKDLPHWMSELNCYNYKNNKLDEEILHVLKPCTNCEESKSSSL